MIARDGACVSLWQDSVTTFQSQNNSAEKKFDVAIAGGGITGITTALLLQKAGKKCIVFEAYNLCFGTTGGTTAHLNTLLDNPYSTIIKNFGKENAQLVAQACKDAIALVKSNIEEYNIDCGFENASAYLFAQTDKQVKELKDIHDACREVNVKALYADKLPVDIEYKKVMIVDGQAKFHPVKYVHALAKAFEDAGGVILQQCRVEDIEENDQIQIVTTKGNFQSRFLIYATHIPPGVNLLDFRCAPYRSYAMAVTLNGDYPEDLAYDLDDPYHYYRTQEIEGIKYFIAGGEDHRTGEEKDTEQCFSRLENYLRKYFQINEVAYKWSSQYFQSNDGLPYIGHLPGNPKTVLVATGYGGNGITYSQIAAQILTDLIVKGQSDFEEVFNPSRVKPVAGFANFVKNAADVTGNFIDKLIPSQKIEGLDEIKNGEAKLVNFENESVALYKDENGKIHSVNPACTHINCTVAWNTAEKTWECPCHGSRFNEEGVMVTAPARKDLERIHLEK